MDRKGDCFCSAKNCIGKMYKIDGLDLFISPNTVKFYENLLKKSYILKDFLLD